MKIHSCLEELRNSPLHVIWGRGGPPDKGGKKPSKKQKQGLHGVHETMAVDDPKEVRKVGETWNALTGPDF